MKKIYSFTLLLASVASFAQVSDSFSGTGTLITNGWVTHSGNTPGQLTISDGSLSYAGINSSGNKTSIVSGNSEDVNKASAEALTGAVYYSAILNVLNTTGLHENTGVGDYFLMTTATVGSTNVTAFSGRLYLKAGTAENTFNLGVLNNSGGAANPTYAATNYPVGTTIFVVVKYDLAANTASLFVNPTIGGTEGAALVSNVTGTTAAPAQIAGIAIRQGGNATTGTGNVEIDELRLGGTWAYVTSASLSVNQNAIAGLKVFPNPVTNGTLFITSDNNETKSVAIYDVLGKQVAKATVADQAVNVSNLKGGVYIVKITEEGKTATRKLVIK